MAKEDATGESGINWRSKFRELLSTIPNEYPAAGVVGSEISDAFLSELAAALQPRLNTYILTLPQDSLEDKQNTATWINRELREKKLSIRCPRSQAPGILLADTKDGEHSDDTRFRLRTHDKDGRRLATCTWRSLPELELMPAPLRRESLSRDYQPYKINARDRKR
jgi:hypothetical protein